MNSIFRFAFILSVLLSAAELSGQAEIVLQKRENPRRTKSLPLDVRYEIKLRDTLYICKIVRQNPGSLTIVSDRTEYDTVFHSGDETPHIYAAFFHDTTNLPFTEIQYIEKDWFKTRDWLMPAMNGALLFFSGIILLPVAAYADGGAGFKAWYTAEAILAGFSFPQIFIGTRKSKFDLQNKWVIVP